MEDEVHGIGSIEKFNELLNRKKEKKADPSKKRMVLTKTDSRFPTFKEASDDPLLQQTVQQFSDGPLNNFDSGPFSIQLGKDVSLLLFVLASLGLCGSLFYSKIMFKFEHLNPMEAVYVNSLVVFSMMLLLLMTYINNWCRSYRNRTHSAMQSFKFPETSSVQSETYQR